MATASKLFLKIPALFSSGSCSKLQLGYGNTYTWNGPGNPRRTASVSSQGTQKSPALICGMLIVTPSSAWRPRSVMLSCVARMMTSWGERLMRARDDELPTEVNRHAMRNTAPLFSAVSSSNKQVPSSASGAAA